jgi:hypothetical protein
MPPRYPLDLLWTAPDFLDRISSCGRFDSKQGLVSMPPGLG